MINIVHTIPGLHPNSGGPARTVTSLCASLANTPDLSVSLLTQRVSGEPEFHGALPQDLVYSVESHRRLRVISGQFFQELLESHIAQTLPDIIHDHGLWLPVNHIVAKLAKKNSVLRVVHTRGMLEPWALSHNSYKKKLAWWMYQKRDLESVSLFFATAESEADSIRTLGFKQPIAIISNGVDLPEYDLQVAPRVALERQRSVVFMSRIHPKKGLIQLMEAWAKIRPTGWKLTLAGPDEANHLQEVLACALKLGLGDQVEYTGVVEGKSKAELLRRADLFILPSFSENFGVVVAEALAHGVPVISTLGTPWQGLEENNCGWWVEAKTETLAGALREAMSLNDEDRYRMGLRAQRYARMFDWTQIAHETAATYHWLLGLAERPNCVRLD